jgi:hypothetical protein
MSNWMKLIMVVIGSLLINLGLDNLLGISLGSGRDYLIYFSVFGVLYYFFIWKQRLPKEKL